MRCRWHRLVGLAIVVATSTAAADGVDIPRWARHAPAFATLERVDGKSRVVLASGLALADDGARTSGREDVFVEYALWSGPRLVSLYAKLGLAIEASHGSAGARSTTEGSAKLIEASHGSAGARSTTEGSAKSIDATALSNTDVGAAYVRSFGQIARIVLRGGAILPSASDASAGDGMTTAWRGVGGHRVVDLALAGPRAVGGRASASLVGIRSECSPLLDPIGHSNTCFVRLDAGVDVYAAEDAVHVVPRLALGVGAKFPIGAFTLEAAGARDDALATTIATSGHLWHPDAAWLQPGLVVSAPLSGPARGFMIALDIQLVFGHRATAGR